MKKYKIMISLLLILILQGTLLVGCGNVFDTKDPTQDEDVIDDSLIMVGVSQIGSESVWRTANTVSLQNSFTKENGYFLIFENARQKQENQIKSIRSFISQRVDYIIFSPITENGWETVLQEAKQAKIPVILMDRQVSVKDSSLYTSWVGSDFEKEGRDAGEWLVKNLKETGRQSDPLNIVVLKGTEDSTSVIGRSTGFNSIARQHNNWNILEEVDADFTTTKGKETMTGFLEKYENIDVVVSQNDDMTFGAIEAIEEAGLSTGIEGDITVISFDAVKAALQMVKEGKINVDVECNPDQGPYIERVIRNLEKGSTVQKKYYVPERVFTQKNVDSVIEERTY